MTGRPPLNDTRLVCATFDCLDESVNERGNFARRLRSIGGISDLLPRAFMQHRAALLEDLRGE